MIDGRRFLALRAYRSADLAVNKKVLLMSAISTKRTSLVRRTCLLSGVKRT